MKQTLRLSVTFLALIGARGKLPEAIILAGTRDRREADLSDRGKLKTRAGDGGCKPLLRVKEGKCADIWAGVWVVIGMLQRRRCHKPPTYRALSTVLASEFLLDATTSRRIHPKYVTLE